MLTEREALAIGEDAGWSARSLTPSPTGRRRIWPAARGERLSDPHSSASTCENEM
jgi:hypothetical protein